MDGLPVRGTAVHALDLPLPPARMPMLRGGRPLKRWRYVGVYGPELMLCVGDARIGPVRAALVGRGVPGQAHRGAHHRRPRRRGRSPARVRACVRGDVEIDIEFDEGEPCRGRVTRTARQYIWTREAGRRCPRAGT